MPPVEASDHVEPCTYQKDSTLELGAMAPNNSNITWQ